MKDLRAIPQERQLLREMISKCYKEFDNFTDGELEFLENTEIDVIQYHRVSKEQEQKLKRMFDKIYKP